MQEYLTTTSVGDLIRMARGTQDMPKAASAGTSIDIGTVPSTGVQVNVGNKGRDLS
jgi:hypothetical protein